MAEPSLPLRTLIRRTSHSLARRSASPQPHLLSSQPVHRQFSQSPHPSYPRRTRHSPQQKLEDLFRTPPQDEDDEDTPRFSLNTSERRLMSHPGIRAAHPRESGTVGRVDTSGTNMSRNFFFTRGVDHDEDEEVDMDDITSNAHGELEQVRELRELSRVISWDGPMLWQYRREFQKPTEKTPLRFRYTSYLGEAHPGSRKVVLEFRPRQLPDLNDVQRGKLVKLLGVRFDPQTKWAKMSSEKYPTAPQNKNHLVTLLEGLLKEAREGQDTLEDVPFDFRHKLEKPKPKFPTEWRLTEERRRYLEGKWAENRQLEQTREVEGTVADGRAAMGVPVEAMGRQPEMVVTVRKRHK